MADSSRPITPFLPPEIISRILHFIHIEATKWNWGLREPKEYGLIAKISSSWRDEAQRRMFKTVNISGSTTKKLLKVLEAIQDGKGALIESLDIHLSSLPQDPIFYSHLLRLLVQSQNLKFLSIDLQSWNGWHYVDYLAEPGQDPPLYLPNLVHVTLSTQAPDLTKSLFEQLLLASPNLAKLDLQFWSPHAEVSKWITPPFSKLKEVKMWSRDFIDGNVYDVASFEGLEKLSLSFLDVGQDAQVDILDLSCMKFFEIVGPTLKELRTCGGVAIPQLVYNLLPVLETLYANPLCSPGEDSSTLILPPTLSKLAIYGFEDPLLPLSTLTRLQHLLFFNRETFYDLSTLPPLETLTVSGMVVKRLLESLENIEVGTFPSLKLILGNGYHYYLDLILNRDHNGCDLAEVPAIKKRCKALKINMVKYVNRES